MLFVACLFEYILWLCLVWNCTFDYAFGLLVVRVWIVFDY